MGGGSRRAPARAPADFQVDATMEQAAGGATSPGLNGVLGAGDPAEAILDGPKSSALPERVAARKHTKNRACTGGRGASVGHVPTNLYQDPCSVIVRTD